jgi:phosphomannomutase/phosphoglucomutase
MNTQIFRQYDIRGIADRDLDNELVFGLGLAFAHFAKKKLGKSELSVVVGRDARVSSDRIFCALADGLVKGGATVVDIGMVPTPLVYFARVQGSHDACIQITGSHNAGEYNGFKMMVGADTLHGAAIQELRGIIADKSAAEAAQPGEIIADENVISDYLNYVGDNIKMGSKPLKVVVDCGNGIAGVAAPQLVQDVLGAQMIPLFVEPDGNFPNHHPDPTVLENLQDVMAAVREHQADLGIAYDGDGDRIGVVDHKGEVIWGDKLMILLSRDVLKSNPGATIIGEVKCSQTLFDDIQKHGGNAVMSKVGHSLIKAKIKETGAKLAGEMSGHIFFNDRYFGFDDALYATARLLEILSNTDQDLGQLLGDVPETFATPELRLDCPDDVKFDVPGKVAEQFSKEWEVNTLDGVRINFGDGWGLVRASNTGPVLVMRVEAGTPERRDELLGWLENAVKSAIA